MIGSGEPQGFKLAGLGSGSSPGASDTWRDWRKPGQGLMTALRVMSPNIASHGIVRTAR